ncbi:hypothetical protein ACFLZO_00295 [Patescibacteria group bacterium]
MSFQHIVQVLVAHTPAGEVVVHYHLWHVALAALVPLCVLMFVGIYVLDLRQALRETKEENDKLSEQVASHRGLVFSIMRNLRGLFEPLQDAAAKLQGADADMRGAGEVMTTKMQEIGTLLNVVNAAHEQNQRDAQVLGEKNAQVDKNLSDLTHVREQQLQEAARLQEGAKVLDRAQTAVFGTPKDKDTVH